MFFFRTCERYHTSSRQAKLEYEEVQRNFINDHSNDDPDDEPVEFTALNIIEYIEQDCICSNDKALQRHYKCHEQNGKTQRSNDVRLAAIFCEQVS